MKFCVKYYGSQSFFLIIKWLWLTEGVKNLYNVSTYELDPSINKYKYKNFASTHPEGKKYSICVHHGSPIGTDNLSTEIQFDNHYSGKLNTQMTV